MNINQAIAQKVLETVDVGLVEGLGEPVPGRMCVEAAVCFAMGLEHSDNPPCVGSAVRAFKIRLNDSRWSSDAARAKGMRKLAIAQLGSNEIDQVEFAKKLSEQTIKILIPVLFRKIAPSLPEEHQRAFLKAADRCEQEGTADAANAARAAAYAAANAAANAADAAADAYAAAAAVYAAYAAADAADAAARAAADATNDAADAYVTARAARAAADAAVSDEFLILSAGIALNILIEMKSPGCEFLHLCD